MFTLPLFIHLAISIILYLVGITISIRIWHLFPKRPMLKVQSGEQKVAENDGIRIVINDFKVLLT